MIQQEQKVERQSPDNIRSESFTHRMRGLDEDEVRDYLDLLADQVQAADAELGRKQAELNDLHRRNRELRDEIERGANEISPQAVALFSQAQQVADQLVEEAVVHARDLMSAARAQQRDILQRAHRAAQEAVHRTSDAAAEAAAPMPSGGYSTPIPQVEYVRTFAQVAQVQLRSVLDALTEQVDRLGDLPRLESNDTAPVGIGDGPQAFPMPHSRAQTLEGNAGGDVGGDDDSRNTIYHQVRSIGRNTD